MHSENTADNPAADRTFRARCQTSDSPLSQQQAAAEAVQKIGLNQIKEVDLTWFTDKKTKEMFFQRLDYLKSVEKNKA